MGFEERKPSNNDIPKKFFAEKPEEVFDIKSSFEGKEGDLRLTGQARLQSDLGYFDVAEKLASGIRDEKLGERARSYIDEARLRARVQDGTLGEGGVYEVPGLTEEDAKRAEEAARKAREKRESEGRA